MSADFSFEIHAASQHQLTISLGGKLTGGDLERVESDVREAIGKTDGDVGILWDLRKVRTCDLGARQSMQKLQSEIAAKKLRSAYVASRPRIRGVALWIVHTSGDALSRPFANADQAWDWLDASSGRVEAIVKRAEEFVSWSGRKGGGRW